MVRRRLELADVVVSLGADDDDGRTLLERFFGRLPTSHRTADLRIDLTVAPFGGPRGERSTGGVWQGPTRRQVSERALHVDHELGATATATSDRIGIACPLDVVDRWRAVRHLLFSTLSWWFERRGRLVLHAAMIARANHAALILGGTGSGKSTAAYAANRGGWDLCSDDLVVVGARAGALHGFGIPRSPTVPRPVARIAASQAAMPTADERDRIVLVDHPMATGWRSLRCTIVATHDAGAGTLRRLDHAGTMEAILGASLEGTRSDVLQRRLSLVAAAAALPCFLLAHAADEATRVQRARELIDGAWDSSTDPAQYDPSTP